jgi:GNAT superfamily N-acetyltransferase
MTAVRDGGPQTLVRCRQEPPRWQYAELLIRRYCHPVEFEPVLALHRTGLAQVGLRPGDGVYYESDLFQMEELYLGNGGEFLVGVREGRLVAMGGLRRFTGAPGAACVGEMVRLRVHPPLQRLGYASALVAALEERAVELGYTELRADTTAFQQPALELYKRFGWQEKRRDVINGIVNVYLEKTLLDG